MNLHELYSDFHRPSHILLRGLFATVGLLLVALLYGWLTEQSGFGLVGVALLVPAVLTTLNLVTVWLRPHFAAPPANPPEKPAA